MADEADVLSERVRATIRRIAGFGLPWSDDTPIEMDDASEWPQLLEAVRQQKLEGLFAAAVSAGMVNATEDVLERARQHNRHAQHAALLLEARALRVYQLLEGTGLDSRLIKGPVAARGLYANPNWRLFRDVDVLLPGNHLDRAIALLTAEGMQRPHPQLRDGWDRRFAKTVMLVDVDGVQIDLHRTLVKGPFGLWILPADLFSQSREVSIAGHAVKTLSREAELLGLAYHAALGDVPPRLGPLRDVAEALGNPEVDLDRLLAMARSWQGESVLRRAVGLVERELGGCPSAGSIVTARLSRRTRHRRLLRTNVRFHDNGLAVALMGVLALPNTRSRLTYVRSLTLPDRAYLTGRGLTQSGWIRRSGDSA